MTIEEINDVFERNRDEILAEFIPDEIRIAVVDLLDNRIQVLELEGASFWLAVVRARIALCPGTDRTGTTNETGRSTSDGFSAIFITRFPPRSSTVEAI
jgi:hypothetical protein